MKITTFNTRITKKEGKKISVSKAQVDEIVRLIDEETNGGLKKLIRSLPEPQAE